MRGCPHNLRRDILARDGSKGAWCPEKGSGKLCHPKPCACGDFHDPIKCSGCRWHTTCPKDPICTNCKPVDLKCKHCGSTVQATRKQVWCGKRFCDTCTYSVRRRKYKPGEPRRVSLETRRKLSIAASARWARQRAVKEKSKS